MGNVIKLNMEIIYLYSDIMNTIDYFISARSPMLSLQKI